MKISEKNILPAFLLALLLGGFGAHRFYVKKSGTATIMLLLSLSIIGLLPVLVWAWIDIIMILTGNFKDKEGNLLKDWT